MYKCTGLALMIVICAVFTCSCSGNDDNNKQEESKKETINNTEISEKVGVYFGKHFS